MRPRLITAENAENASPNGESRHSFNEAAAHHRGERSPSTAPGSDVDTLQ